MSVRVRVFLRAGRRCFEAQWTDPVTGKKRTRTTGRTTRSEALRFAARLEADLEAGRFRERERLDWSAFVLRYDREVLAGLRATSRLKILGTLRAVDRIVSPRWVSGIGAAEVGRLQVELRAAGLAPATIKGHLVNLRAALRWAERLGLVREVPRIDIPRRVGGMKGRPITDEEYGRILAAVPGVMGSELAGCWVWLLDGLWASGLRLGEALALEWRDDRHICVDLSGRRPMFRIRASAGKGKRDRLLPMAPEFAELLERVPEPERRGRVFRPRGPELERLSLNWVSKMIIRFCRAAGVSVGTVGDRQKWAGAHDFRRAFGFRWSRRVMPAVLMELMRHSSIVTTMEFYVGRNAEATADTVWEAVPRRFANKTANNGAALGSVHRLDSSEILE